MLNIILIFSMQMNNRGIKYIINKYLNYNDEIICLTFGYIPQV